MRSDKGEIRATKRDFGCLEWMAHQYVARGDQIQRLLSRYPDPKHPSQGEWVSASTTRGQINRWVRAGWVVYKRVLATGPGWVYVTRAGLHLVGLEKQYTARPPSLSRLEHLYAVNQVRLWMEEDYQYPWTSERLYRASLHLKRGERSGPIPDGVIRVDGEKVAVEVQLSELNVLEWEKKLSDLVRFTVESESGLGYEQAFSEIWVYVPTEAMYKVAEAARVKVDARDCIEVDFEDDLFGSGEKNGWAQKKLGVARKKTGRRRE